MTPKFGTSGLRGIVTKLTDEFISDYTRAFLASCPNGGTVYVGWDLRPSSPRIAEAVIKAAQNEGITPVRAGMLPTPALALASMKAKAAAIMITGSHIPADRNGLKFYLPEGEISKDDELRIKAALGQRAGAATAVELEEPGIAAAYVDRYVSAFGPTALAGLRIGVYEHSSAARDFLTETVAKLGADALPLARSDTFIPVDTEAVDAKTRTMLCNWCQEHKLDAVISTDGDADRPMVTDASGHIVPGDVLGPLTAQFLGACAVCTPVSSNTAVDHMGFARIERTRIGSPFVIAAMESVLTSDPGAAVVGYEANGGFLLGFTAQGICGPISPLMTRDCLLPILAPLAQARAQGLSLAELAATLPHRFTASDRIQGIETATSGAFIAELIADPAKRAGFFDTMTSEIAVDTTDGLRVTFEGDDIIHLRPSGNAPEFRCYAEADSKDKATALVVNNLEKLRSVLR